MTIPKETSKETAAGTVGKRMSLMSGFLLQAAVVTARTQRCAALTGEDNGVVGMSTMAKVVRKTIGMVSLTIVSHILILSVVPVLIAVISI